MSITLIFVFINIIGLPDRTTNFFEYILNIFLLNGFIGIPYVDGAHWYLTNLIILIIISSILLKYSIITKIWPYAVWIVTGLFIKYIGLNSITKLICGKYIGVIIAAIMLNAIKNESNIKMKKKYFFLLQICYVYNFTNGYVFAIISIISNLIVYIVMEEKFKFLNNKVLVYIGEISYPLYLVHQNISMSIEYILYNYFHQSYYIWFAFIAIIVSVIIASIIHNKIEKNEKTLNFLFELLSFEK